MTDSRNPRRPPGFPPFLTLRFYRDKERVRYNGALHFGWYYRCARCRPAHEGINAYEEQVKAWMEAHEHLTRAHPDCSPLDSRWCRQ